MTRTKGPGLRTSAGGRAHLHVGVELTKGRVILEQVRRLLGSTGVVDADDLEVGLPAAVLAAQELAADAAEAVDGDLELLLRGRLDLVGVAARLHGAPTGQDGQMPRDSGCAARVRAHACPLSCGLAAGDTDARVAAAWAARAAQRCVLLLRRSFASARWVSDRALPSAHHGA